MDEVVKSILLFIYAVISVVFVLFIMTQSSKNEGFGTIGVQAPTNFKGKPGYEERMKSWTLKLGVSWFALGIIIAWVFAHI